jgi:hypothetical protein
VGSGGNPTRCSALTSLMPLGWPFDQVGCKDTWYILIILGPGPVQNPPCFGPLNIIEYQPPICVCLCASLLPMARSLGPVRACQPDFSLPIEKILPMSILWVVSSGTVYLESSQFRAILFFINSLCELYVFLPKSYGPLGVLTIGVKAWCSVKVSL